MTPEKKAIDYKLNSAQVESLFSPFVNILRSVLCVLSERHVDGLRGDSYHTKRTPIFDFSLFFFLQLTVRYLRYTRFPSHPDSRYILKNESFRAEIWNSSSRTLVSVRIQLVEAEREIKKHKIAAKKHHKIFSYWIAIISFFFVSNPKWIRNSLTVSNNSSISTLNPHISISRRVAAGVTPC